MKHHLIVGICALLLVAGCDKGKTKGSGEFKTDEQKYSYALGQQFGKNIASLNVPLDRSVLIQSLQSALDKKESKMDEKQIQEAMGILRDARMAKMKSEGEKNKKTGQDFLEKNKSNKDVKVTASGLQYQVLSEGTGAKPSETDTVEVHYVGTLIDGTEFDNSVKRGLPAKFGVNRVIPGWTEALQMMNEGSKWKLFIPSELAYGDMDRPNIPANSVLIFDVDLLRVVKNEDKPAKPEVKKPKGK